MDWRLIFDPPAPGSWNMALDEALLDAAGQGTAPAACGSTAGRNRRSRWGTSKRYADRRQHPSSRDCAAGSAGDRRRGHYPRPGADLQPDAPGAKPAQLRPAVVLRRVARDPGGGTGNLWRRCRALFAGLCGHRRAVTRHPASSPSCASSAAARGTCCWDPEKSPAVPNGGIEMLLLQHGSVLLARSRAAPELPGIYELSVGADRTAGTGGPLGRTDRPAAGGAFCLRNRYVWGASGGDPVSAGKIRYIPWTCRR